MADAFDFVQNGLLIKDVALGDFDFQPEALADDAPEDLGLHFAHQRHLDLFEPWIPADLKLRILGLQTLEIGQHLQGVGALAYRRPHQRFVDRVVGLLGFQEEVTGNGGSGDVLPVIGDVGDEELAAGDLQLEMVVVHGVSLIPRAVP